MPKAILEFNIDDPYEAEEHALALHGKYYKMAIDEIFTKLRSLEKYENKKSMKIDDIRALLLSCLEDYDIK